MYFSASVFAALGFDHPTATGMIIAVVNFLFTLVALRVSSELGDLDLVSISCSRHHLNLISRGPLF